MSGVVSPGPGVAISSGCTIIASNFLVGLKVNFLTIFGADVVDESWSLDMFVGLVLEGTAVEVAIDLGRFIVDLDASR